MQALPSTRRSLTSIFTLPSSILPFRSHSTSATTTRASSKSSTPKTSRSSSRKSSFSHIAPEQQLNEKNAVQFTSRSLGQPESAESDSDRWVRMLALQKQYHCYNSARLEAAVEALERGWGLSDIPMPSRYCLDLMNEELQAQMENSSFELDHGRRVSY
ncbi:hypothetical protein BP6252_10549 [Coleophoma cylindrospora]|uniref:Uncharacterized protein n=1 Tax=Coleophoma cylindrospora TaxID=1849047 RepID=A0A3D8QT88_9HELO|nr:hypothetical protein BP6252_10549 [Coleophoma cylindrospora]